MLDQQKNESFAMLGAARIKIKDLVSGVVAREASSLAVLERNVPESAVLLVEKIIGTRGKVIFSGIGKSGLVAQKLAATFSSLGIPSIFVHACEAMHGDIGVIQAHDLFVGLSKSGTGTELEGLYSALASQKNYSVLICCGDGHLCSVADLVVKLPFDKEACSLNLAPTSSSTVMIAFGDAIAVAVSTLKNFDKTDFAKNHPAGALGRRLVLTVQHFMHAFHALPLVLPTAEFSEILYEISSKKLGVGIVADSYKKLLGLITDGDLRRACDKFGPSVFSKKASEIMTVKPKTIDLNSLASQALAVMEDSNITSLIVVQNETVVGVIHIHDLIKAGIKG